MHEGAVSPCPHQHLCFLYIFYFYVLILIILMSVRWYLLVLICIFLMINEHLIMNIFLCAYWWFVYLRRNFPSGKGIGQGSRIMGLRACSQVSALSLSSCVSGLGFSIYWRIP